MWPRSPAGRPETSPNTCSIGSAGGVTSSASPRVGTTRRKGPVRTDRRPSGAQLARSPRSSWKSTSLPVISLSLVLTEPLWRSTSQYLPSNSMTCPNAAPWSRSTASAVSTIVRSTVASHAGSSGVLLTPCQGQEAYQGGRPRQRRKSACSGRHACHARRQDGAHVAALTDVTTDDGGKL